MLLALLGLKIAVATCLFFEGFVLLAMVFGLVLVGRTHWEIEFQGNNIHLYNTGNRQSYSLKNLTQSDLCVKQSRNQKIRNCCDLKIADTPFGIYDVKQCAELCMYIQQNIPE